MSSEAPKVNRYRLIQGYSEKLRYRSAAVNLTYCGNREGCWMLYATKEGDPTSFLEIMRRPTMHEWSHARFEGFDLVADSPADKILQKMVREGNAVKMAAGEQFYQKRGVRSR